MTALDIACRYVDAGGHGCAAQAGEPCRWPCRMERDTFHEERVADASAMTRIADPVSTAAFDQAVENSGLV